MVNDKSNPSKAIRLTRQQKGRIGEEAALAWLKEQGYLILERNWRCRSGEIDIIAQLDGLVIFVEVRSRSHVSKFGTPQESVDARKIHQVRSTAAVYLQSRGTASQPQIRFDVVAVMLDHRGTTVSVNHIVNAF